jgi:hypothetical protein
MGKLSGWQKAGVVAGVGCLSIIGICVVAVVAAVMWARASVADLGDPTPTRTERTIAIPGVETPTPATGETPAASVTPLRLRVDLEEGSFVIQPGPAGSQVKVEGTFAPGFHELTEQTQADPAGGAPETTIRFRPKAPIWTRILAGLGGDGNNRPQLSVVIPEGQPIDLTLRVAMGESRIDLGGLTLTGLGVDLSMGNHEVDFTKPVVEGLRRMRLTAQMGNVTIEHLGNARAAEIEASGSMGNLTADLGGEWLPGGEAEVSFSQSMGEVRVDVPKTVRLEADISNAQRESDNRRLVDEEVDPKAPIVRLRVSASMGEGRVGRY